MDEMITYELEKRKPRWEKNREFVEEFKKK
jgi:hypothetical protein